MEYFKPQYVLHSVLDVRLHVQSLEALEGGQSEITKQAQFRKRLRAAEKIILNRSLEDGIEPLPSLIQPLRNILYSPLTGGIYNRLLALTRSSRIYLSRSVKAIIKAETSVLGLHHSARYAEVK